MSALTIVSGVCANLLYHNLLDAHLTIQPDDRQINFYVRASDYGNQQQAAAIKVDTITYGLPLLLALVLATSADSWRGRCRALLASLLIMVLFTILIVMLRAKVTSLELDARIAAATMQSRSNSAGFFSLIVHGYAFSQPVIAVLVWFAMLLLGVFKDTVKPVKQPSRVKPESIARNAPCPCGSGRKYKRCCGRA